MAPWMTCQRTWELQPEVQLLLEEWDIGTDRDQFTYHDPYDEQPATSNHRSKLHAEMRGQRSSTCHAVHMGIVVGSPNEVKSKRVSDLPSDSHATMMSTQYVPGPCGGWLHTGKKKIAKGQQIDLDLVDISGTWRAEGRSHVMSTTILKRKRAPSPQPVEDTPVLSHAAKRKQKRALLVESTTVSKKQKEEEAVSTPVKRQNSIWVGNLSYKTTQESLKRFFDGVGEITRVHLPTKPGKALPGESARRENRGFAYVDFATLEAKNTAVVMTESPLDGRRLLIKDGDDFEGRPQNTGAGDGAVTQGKNQSSFARKILSVQKQQPAPTLFFGNLGFNTTVDSIRGVLEAHRAQPGPAGEDIGVEAPQDPWIRKIRMGTFEDSGLCKGFAFVDFTSTEHATATLLHPKNHHLDGRKLVVEYASPDAVRRGGGPGSRPKKVSNLVATAGKARRERRESVIGNREERESLERPSGPRDEKSLDSGRRSGASKNGPRKSRPAPGAALALAKREQVAIVPSQGRRITFND